MKLILEFVFAFLSTFGFGIITNVPRRTLLPAGITGALGWLVYLSTQQITGNIIVSNILAAILIGFLANYVAVAFKSPVNIIYVPCLVSLVPGALFYKSMRSFVLGHNSAALQGIAEVLTIAVSLGIGFVVAETVFNKLKPWIRKIIK